MTAQDLLLVGVKGRVLAISKTNGEIEWSTQLSGGMNMGNPFVSLLADERFVFAHGRGEIHCLDIRNGEILWTNSLSGCGYGLATLAFANGASSPDVAAISTILEEEERAALARR